MSNSKRFTGRVGLVCTVVVLALPLGTQGSQAGDQLQHAVTLFEQGQYSAAEDALLELEIDDLNSQERLRRDQYLSRVEVAILLCDKAARQLEEGRQALGDDNYTVAAENFQNVLANPYASPAQLRDVETYMEKIEQALAERQVEQTDDNPPTVLAAAVVEQVEDAEGDGDDDTGNEDQLGEADVQKDDWLEDETWEEPAGTQFNLVAFNDQAVTVEELVENAYDAIDVGQYDEAERLFEEALALSPGHPDAVAGLEQVRQHRQVEGGGIGLIHRIKQRKAILWGRTVATFEATEQQIHELAAEGLYDETAQSLEYARQAIEANKINAEPAEKYENLLSRWESLATYLEEEEQKFHEREVLAVREEIEHQKAERIRQIRDMRDRQVNALMSEAHELRSQRDYCGAIEILKQVIAIDPQNDPARWLTDVLEDRDSYRGQLELRKDFEGESREVLIDIQRAKIPWHKDIYYPKDWLEISTRRSRADGGAVPRSRVDVQLQAKLKSNVPVVAFQARPFSEVIEELADMQGVNFSVIWNDLASAGVARDTEVTCNLRDVSFETALDQILDSVETNDVDVDFAVADGVIRVASRDLLDKDVYVEVYDIKDIIMSVPDFLNAPKVGLTLPKQPSHERPYFDDADTEGAEEESYGDDSDSRVAEIINLIRKTIESGSWRENGGTVASISELNGNLVITQTSDAHGRVQSLLGKLREERTVQIAVETLFITVQSNFLEEMGIDLDIVLNAGNAGYDRVNAVDPITGTQLLLPRSFSRLGFTPGVPAGGTAMNAAQNPIQQPWGNVVLVPPSGQNILSSSQGTPIPIIANVLDITNPARLASDLPGTFAGNDSLRPALSIFGSFLDNIQVDFLIRATQADTRTSLMTAPRLVLFNGQRSNIAVIQQQAFVSQLQPVVAAGAAAQAPQIGNVPSGVTMDVEATVSADKRYVTMTLRSLGVARLINIQTFLFSTGPTTGVGASGFVQLPSIQLQEINTTVSIPDGGTLLIGGQKLSGETEIEAGVPILSKIPILKRAYSSRTMVKDEQILLILVKPRILIQRESEENAFPTFSLRR